MHGCLSGATKQRELIKANLVPKLYCLLTLQNRIGLHERGGRSCDMTNMVDVDVDLVTTMPIVLLWYIYVPDQGSGRLACLCL